GFHNSGKTTVIESILQELQHRGYSTSTIKNIHIEGWSIDQEGKDTKRHVRAGANMVGITADEETVLIFPGQKKSLNELIPFFTTDFLVLEGYQHREDIPNIICARSLDDIESLVTSLTFCISGLISDSIAKKHIKGIPVFNASRNRQEITDLVERKGLLYERGYR
ncbi:MAG: molybdopterin-guanine dinucleotide biosynthesis protein B, partial [Candidatus Hodarchaeales archaeon]